MTLRSKGLGVGVMVSAMVSRAYGFGLTLYGNSMKRPLTESPFIRYLEHSSGKEGYWTYRHMVIQIEDCIDCLQCIHPELEYEFELDHSSGHNAERPDGLSTTTLIFNPTAKNLDSVVPGKSVTRKL